MSPEVKKAIEAMDITTLQWETTEARKIVIRTTYPNCGDPKCKICRELIEQLSSQESDSPTIVCEAK